MKYLERLKPLCFESVEARIALDSGGMPCVVDFPDSEFVRTLDDGVLQFVSLRVGEVYEGRDTVILDDQLIVEVKGHELTMREVKEYLHGFADSLGTDQIIETLDLRLSPWGSGSGSTTRRFEEYIAQQHANWQPCTGLRFDRDVQFDHPGDGGEYFTGGFLDLPLEGFGTLLRSGDIAEVVDGYEIVADGEKTSLIVTAQLGEVTFVINDDHTLTDEFDRIWSPKSDYQIMDPAALDEVMGDIDGNGKVDFGDFLILSSQFGTAGPEADLDCNGKVEFADFLILSGNFGQSADEAKER